MKTQLKYELYKQSGLPLIEINEETEFQKPVSINGYEAKNYNELRDMFECGVITLEKFDELIMLLQIGELGIIKKRKKYKELYEEQLSYSQIVNARNKKLANLLKEIEQIAIDNNYKEIIEKIERGIR